MVRRGWDFEGTFILRRKESFQGFSRGMTTSTVDMHA